MSDYQVSGDITADVSSLVRDVDKAIRKLHELDSGVSDLIRHMDELDGKTATIDIKGLQEVDDAIAKLDELDSKRATADVEIRGIEEARADLDILDIELDRLDHKRVHVDIDCDDHCLKAIERDAEKATSAIGGGGMGGGGLLGAISLLGPALVPIGAVAIGGLGAIASSAGVAAGGIGAFAAFAIPTIQEVTKNSANLTKVQAQLSAATTGSQVAAALTKQKAILDSMSPSMTKAVKEFGDFKQTYGDMSKTLQPVIFEVFGKGLQFLTSVLKIAEPIAASVGKELSGLMDSLNSNLHASDVAHDIKDLTDNAAAFVGVWAKSVGNFVVGIMNMLDAFLPLAKDFNGGMLGMSERFRDWTSTLGKNKSFQDFVAYVRENTPPVLHLLGGLVTLVINLGKALAPLGGKSLSGLNDLISGFNNFAKSNPDAAKLVATVTALTVGLTQLPGVSGLASKALAPILEFFTTPIGIGVGIVGGIMALSLAVGKAKDKTAFFKELSGLWKDLKKLGSDLAKELKPLWDFFKDHISGNVIVIMTNIVKVFRDLLPLVKPVAIILGVTLVVALELLAIALRGVTDAIELVVKIVAWGVKEILSPFVWLYDKLVGHSIIPDLVNGIIGWFKRLPGALLGLAESAGKYVINAFIGLPGKVYGFFSSLVSKAIGKAGDLVSWMKGLPGKIIGALGDTGKMLWNAGLNIIGGLIGGIKKKAEDIGGAVGGVLGDIKDHLPWSPAKKGPLRDFPPEQGGRNIVKMIATGIEGNAHLIDNAIGKVTRKFAPDINVAIGAGVSGGSAPRPSTSGGPPAAGAMLAGARIGVYVAPGGIQVDGSGTTTEKSISDQLTRVAKFGAFGNAGTP